MMTGSCDKASIRSGWINASGSGTTARITWKGPTLDQPAEGLRKPTVLFGAELLQYPVRTKSKFLIFCITSCSQSKGNLRVASRNTIVKGARSSVTGAPCALKRVLLGNKALIGVVK